MSQSPPPPSRHGVIGIVTRGKRLLAIRRSRHVVAPGTICFPGGGIEPGETEQEALVREMREELDVEVRPARRIWENVTSWGVHLAWWTCQVDANARFVANPAEVQSVHWFSPSELLQHPDLLQSNRAFLVGVIEGRIDVSVPGSPGS